MHPTSPPAHLAPRDGETRDRLLGDWWLYQLANGHRFSTDDLACGWQASLARPEARRCLDIGCGIGSVGLYTLGLLGHADATLTGVEAQEVSVGLARRSVAANGLSDRVRIVQGDLRDPEVLPADSRFELVTGSPPYIPLGKGLVSPHPQRAACRMELRGSVVDYALSARRWMAPGAAFVYVMSARDERTEAAPPEAGLVVTSRVDLVFREGEAPMIAVVTCARQEDGPHPPRQDTTIVVRRADRTLGETWSALRSRLGFIAG